MNGTARLLLMLVSAGREVRAKPGSSRADSANGNIQTTGGCDSQDHCQSAERGSARCSGLRNPPPGERSVGAGRGSDRKCPRGRDDSRQDPAGEAERAGDLIAAWLRQAVDPARRPSVAAQTERGVTHRGSPPFVQPATRSAPRSSRCSRTIRAVRPCPERSPGPDTPARRRRSRCTRRGE